MRHAHPTAMTRNRPVTSISMWSMLFAVSSGLLHPAHADASITVSGDSPSRMLARELMNVLEADGLPRSDVIMYRDCRVQPDCDGQYPEWFNNADWHAGLESSGVGFVQLELLVGTVTLNRLNRDAAMDEDRIREELSGVLQDAEGVSMVVYVQPMHSGQGDAIRWVMFDAYSNRTVHDGTLTYALEEAGAAEISPAATTNAAVDVVSFSADVTSSRATIPSTGRRQRIAAISAGAVLTGVGGGVLLSGANMRAAYTQDAEVGLLTRDELNTGAQAINLRLGVGYGLVGAGAIVGVGVPILFTAHPGGFSLTGQW